MNERIEMLENLHATVKYYLRKFEIKIEKDCYTTEKLMDTNLVASLLEDLGTDIKYFKNT